MVRLDIDNTVEDNYYSVNLVFDDEYFVVVADAVYAQMQLERRSLKDGDATVVGFSAAKKMFGVDILEIADDLMDTFNFINKKMISFNAGMAEGERITYDDPPAHN
jgi:hypothetical protein